MQMASRKFNRRDMLKMSLLGTAALGLPIERAARTQLAVPRLSENQLPRPFQTEFTVPPVADPVHRDATTDYYEMTMKQGQVQIIPGLPKTEVWGYEGITPGPTIVAQRGRNVVVRHRNEIWSDLHEHTSVHLHGNASKPQYDGYANDTTTPGEYKDYRYPNTQDARTLWYHDHGVHVTALNAYMGCAAFYISHDDHEMSLPIPKGRYDVPLVLRDAIFGTDGQLVFDDGSSRGGHDSLFGDVILANGAPWPVMKVERRKYRFRILNAAISRGFNLALSSGEPLTIIGHDGGLAPAPVEVRSYRHGMAERYEVVIDFEKYPIGQSVELRNLGLENTADFAMTDRVMRFDVVSEATDLSDNEVPQVLSNSTHPYSPMKLRESQAVRTRRFRLGRSTVNGQSMWTINGKIWDPNRVDANPGLNDVEIWEFENKSGGWFHPVHIHLVDFKILGRKDGDSKPMRPPQPWERGPKDVAYVAEGEIVRMIMKFGPHKGRYMIHCHNLVHEDHDMMIQFQVGTGGDPWASAPAGPSSEAPPLYGTPETPPPPPPNAPPTVSFLRPTPNKVTRDRTPTIVAKVTDDESLGREQIRFLLDGSPIEDHDYEPESGTLTYTCGRLKLGWHRVEIVAADGSGNETTETARFRVVLR
jgi:spore coat protein A, manganese oxidase